MSRVVIFEVTGMHCASCERVIGKVLQEISGVMEVEVSLKQQRAAIRLPDGAPDPDLAAVKKSLQSLGYGVYPKGQRPVVCDVAGPKDPWGKRMIRALMAFAAVGIVILVLSPIRRALPSVSVGASVGALFLLGIVASLSTCLATTGGFLLAYTSKNPTKRTAVSVHIGRLAAFIVGGAVLGAIGGTLPQGSAAWYGALSVVLGVGFLFVGLNLLELSPSLARMGIRMPAKTAKWADQIAASQKGITPFLVGAITFILPCGFTQTAQALALASGSAQRGLLFMAAFAIGTLPVLFGLTIFGSVATFKNRMLRLATGAALMVFALGQIDGGLTVLGSPVTPSSLFAGVATTAATAAIPTANAQEQVVKMTVAYGEYQPRNLSVKKGVPVRWEIDGQDISGCASSIVVPTYGISRPLSRGLNVIQFTPKQAGTIPFSCGMGMIRGSFTVTE